MSADEGLGDVADLDRVTVRSGVFQIGTQGVQVALMLATGVILARILSTRDFGLFAMANSLMMFVVTFRDLGIPAAIVQREKLDESELSDLFWVGMRANVVIAVAIALSGPLLVRFYHEPKLSAIALVMACASLANGIAAQSEALLMRRMRFANLNVIEIGVYVAGSAAAIVAALSGWGYWALVVQHSVVSLCRTIALWLMAGWRPSRPSRSIARSAGSTHGDMLSYGRNLSGFRILDHVGRHLGQILVGYSQGAAAAGMYFNAQTWASYPMQKVLAPLQRVAVSGLSRIQNDPARFLASISKGALLLTGVVLPLLAFFVVEPSLTIRVLLGEKWLPAAPIFQMLALASIAMVVTRLMLWINLATGNADRQFRWGIVRAAILVLAASVGLQWGAVGVATAYAIASWVQALPEIMYCLAATTIRLRDFAKMVARPLLSCSVAVGMLLLADALAMVQSRDWVGLVLRILIFSAAYASAWLLIPGGRAITLQLIRIPSLGFGQR